MNKDASFAANRACKRQETKSCLQRRDHVEIASDNEAAADARDDDDNDQNDVDDANEGSDGNAFIAT